MTTKMLSAAVVAIGLCGAAQAATVTRACGGAGSPLAPGAVVTTPASLCELGTDQGNPGQNNDTATRVNADAMFGFSDWTYLAKDNDLNGTDEGPQQAALSIVGSVLGGTFTVSPVPGFNQYMLVFRGGNQTPDTYVGYFLGALSGSYTSPFQGPNNNAANISHVTLYARFAEMAEVPLPAAGLMLLAALGGLGLVRRGRAAA